MLAMAGFFLAVALSGPSVDPSVEARAREIEARIIAPCCWTQPVSRHYSEVALEIRKQVREMLAAGRSGVHAVIGSMHLLRAPAQRIEATAAALVECGVHEIAPCHCTGFGATSYFRHRFGERCIPCSVGFEYRVA